MTNTEIDIQNKIEFGVVPALDQSLAQIAKEPIHDRTSHAGNLSKTSQQLLPITQAKILMFSGNQGKDGTYNPMEVRVDGDTFRIAKIDENPEKLTPFIKADYELVNEVANILRIPQLSEAQSIAQVHLIAAQELWGQEKVEMNYSIFKTQIGRLVVKSLAQVPGTCDRILNSEGILEYAPLTTVDSEELMTTILSIAKASEVGGMPKPTAGPIFSNEAFLVAHAFIRSLPYLLDSTQKEVTIIHSSGPDMIKYTQKEKFQNEVERMAQSLSAILGLRGIRINELIFPASELRMSSPDTKEARGAFHKFSIMVELINALQIQGDEKNEAILRISKKHMLGLEDVEKLTKETKNLINGIGIDLNQEFPKVSGLNFSPREFTQWTMLNDSRRPPIVPAVFMDLNIRQISYFTKIAEQIKNGSTIIPKELPEDLRQ